MNMTASIAVVRQACQPLKRRKDKNITVAECVEEPLKTN